MEVQYEVFLLERDYKQNEEENYTVLNFMDYFYTEQEAIDYIERESWNGSRFTILKTYNK